MRTATFYFERLGRVRALVHVSFVIFFLFSFHVILVYYVKNIFGFSINSLPYLAIKMWKEIVVGLAVLLYALHRIIKGGLIQRVDVLDIVILIFTLIGITYLITAENLLLALWSFRSLFEIFIFYCFGRIVAFNIRDFQNFAVIIVSTCVLTSIFGVIQVEYLGTDFFYEIYGVEEIAVALTSYDYDKIRASSTFITPHEFGLYLTNGIFFLGFLVLSDKAAKKRKLYYLLAALIIFIGLVYTLSRSSYLIVAVSFLLLSVKDWRFLIFSVFILGLGYLALDALGIFSNILAALDGSDPSSSGRLDVLSEAITHYTAYPMGSGLGTVGVVVRRFNPDAPQFEGELFNILAQMGPLALICHLLVYIISFRKAFIMANKPGVGKSVKALSSLIFLMIFALFTRELILPRDFTNYVLGWFVIGGFTSYLNFSTVKIKTTTQ